VGADKVARWLHGVMARTGAVTAEWRAVNGGPALVLSVDGELDAVASVTIRDRVLHRIFIVRNPDKLASLDRARRLARG
jgi:hypothetical protein